VWEPGPPATEEALAGATLIVNISASPYHAGKGAERERMFAQRARDNLAYVAFCGLVGGQDELVFDGHSCVIDHTGETIARAAVMPSRYSSTETQRDARAVAATLGVAAHELPIDDVLDAYLHTLKDELSPASAGTPPALAAKSAVPAAIGTGGPGTGSEDLTVENLQARIRGNLLMALSNRFG